MIYIEKTDEKNIIFLNGNLIETNIPIEFRTDKIENVKPEILEKSPLITNEEEDEDEWEDFLNEEYSLTISSTNGDILDGNNDNTILIPRLSKNGIPQTISKFKWYRNDVFLSDEKLYLDITQEDITDMSDIFTIEAFYMDNGIEKSIESAVEIINLYGLRKHIDEDDEEEINDTFDPDEIFEWGDLGTSFVLSDDFREKDIFNIANNIREGMNKKVAFITAFEEVIQRIFSSVARRGDRSTNIPIIDVFYDINIRLYERYPDVFEIPSNIMTEDDANLLARLLLRLRSIF